MVATVVPLLKAAGVPTMGAHMFAFYYGVVSITPPTALAAVAAAGLARANPMTTMLEASRIGITAYLVPIAFVAQPALLMSGASSTSCSPPRRPRSDELAGALTGHALAPLGALQRLALFAAAFLLLVPIALPPTPPGSCWRAWYSCRRCLTATEPVPHPHPSWSRPPVRSGCRHSCILRAGGARTMGSKRDRGRLRPQRRLRRRADRRAQRRAAAPGAGADRHPLLGSLGRAGAGHAGDRHAGRARTRPIRSSGSSPCWRWHRCSPACTTLREFAPARGNAA